MTSIYDIFKTDADLEQTGFWYQVTKDIRIRLARAGGSNSAFSKALDLKTRPHRREIENRRIDPELADSLLIEAFAESVILGWEGVKDTKGKNLKFSVENAVKLLTDLPELFAEVQQQAQELSNFQAEEIEEDAGN